MRAKNNGTIIYREGKLSKVNTKTGQTISPGVYPAWHPGGRYIAFSVNNIVQAFHSIRQIKVEVTDTLSDIIVLDTENNIVFSSPAISYKDRFETFPTWSPDGKYLYFCSARALPFYQYKNIRYDLLRIPFDETTCKFGTADTVVSASSDGHSVSFPRISPDGKYLMFCMSDFGNFSIWHSESDLFLKNLESGEILKPGINSPQSESYHSWSSDGRWIVFSSRRTDGLFTQLYFSYFDANGNACKPFLLPQKDPEFYSTFLKSYNVPELVTTTVELNPRKLLKTIYSEPLNATFKDISR
jgi:Tol biopolymer transport system component